MADSSAEDDKKGELEQSSSTEDELEDNQQEPQPDLDTESDSDDEEEGDEEKQGKPIPKLKRGGSIFTSTDGSAIDEEQGETVPITISFEHLFYSVKKSIGFWKQLKHFKNPFAKERVYILKDLHGTLYPNEVTAIIGPSGAGKTTLLNFLAGRIQGGLKEGIVRINGVRRKKVGKDKWQRLAAYVMQDDVMLGNLTPKETFAFSAALRRRGFFFGRTKRKQLVSAVIEELGLEDCAKTRVGSALARGISGGQRKRTSIGIELITEPSVLFLDEPTSGLDSSTAYSLVLTLKKLAEAGRTIVTTIHQPSTDIYYKFDRVIVLTRGHIMYNGPAKDTVAYFSKLNYKCPRYTNPCEYVMNLAKDDSYIASKEEGKERTQELVTAYREYQQLSDWDFERTDFENHEEMKQFIHPEGGIKEKLRPLAFWKRGREVEDPSVIRAGSTIAPQHSATLAEANIKAQKRTNFFVQTSILTWRACLSTIRDPMATKAKVIQTLVLALLVGLLYLRVGDDQASIQDREGALFFIVVNQAMASIMGTIVTFPAERQVFIREHVTGAYSTFAYYLSKAISDLPIYFIYPFFFATVTYWMVGFQAEPAQFFIFVAAVIVVANTAQALGLAVSASCKNLQTAQALVPIIFIPLMLFGGFFLNTNNIPYWLTWVQYFSLFKYGYQIVVHNEFHGLTFFCSEGEFTPSGQCPFTTGDEVISALDMTQPQNSLWASFLFLFMQYFLFRTIAYFSLRLTAGRQKGA